MRRRFARRTAAWLAAPSLGLLAACAAPPVAEQASPAPVLRNASAAPAAAPPRPLSPAAGGASASLSANGPAPATPPAPAAGASPPFATVIKGAQRIDGPLTLWRKDDKLWFELLPEQFGQPYLLSPKIKNGIGDALVLGGLMAWPVNGAGGVQVVSFERVHNHVRLQARNTDISAAAGSPQARALAESYAHSLLGSTPVASAPHPDRKSVLVDAGALFLSDMLGVGMRLQRALRQGYGLDRNNTIVTAARGSPQATVIETQHHFFAPSVGTPPPTAPLGAPVPLLPRFVPDTRSLLVGLHFSLSPLPEPAMPTRAADPRLGLFSTEVLDFSDDLRRTPRRRFVNRWRIEKKDPAAEVSDAARPVTFWIDRNVPLAYRDTVRAAILEWNKAFEKIGIRGALAVEQQPDDASWDTLDYGRPSVRWMLNADPVFGAIGPSLVDPRTGEILDADIAFEGLSATGARTLHRQVVAGSAPAAAALAGPAAPLPWQPVPDDMAPLQTCLHGALGAEQLAYAQSVLEASEPGDALGAPEQRFVLDYVRQSIMHEVGHALGLRHNFRASRAYTEAQLDDAGFTAAHGTSGSIMEYNAVNLPSPGRGGGSPFQTTLGPYDYWAIEYAYRPLAGDGSAQALATEQTELRRIAARSAEPLLAYGSDEDAALGLDPETLQLDLGADPLAFAQRRLSIAHALFQRQETRVLSAEHDYAVLRRSIDYALNDVFRSVGVLVRQIGGVRTLRDFPGSGRDPLQPTSARVQRGALDLIARHVLSGQGLSVSPALQRRLAPDFMERDAGGSSTVYGAQQRLLALQRAVLAYLLSDTIAARVLDAEAQVGQPGDTFTLAELTQRLAQEVWRDLPGRAPLSPARRELQREHVNRVALSLLAPSAARTDARSLARAQARDLVRRLQAAQRQRRAGDAATAAHLADCIDTLQRALAATLPRLGL
jgi:hypothetical protein